MMELAVDRPDGGLATSRSEQRFLPGVSPARLNDRGPGFGRSFRRLARSPARLDDDPGGGEGDHHQPRSLTPPGDFVSDPDQERRKTAKRLHPLPATSPETRQDVPQSCAPYQQVKDPSTVTAAAASLQVEEMGSYLSVEQTSKQAVRSPERERRRLRYQRPAMPPPQPQVPPTGKTTPLHNPKNKNVLEQLLNGADYRTINARDPAGRTPLHCFAKRNHLEYTLTLLCAGKSVDIHAQDIEGDTPLHVAVKGDRLMIVNILLAFGASVSVLNHQGDAPYDVATGDIKQFLVQFVPEINDRGCRDVGHFHDLNKLVDPHTLLNARLDHLLHPQRLAAFVGCLDEVLNLKNDVMQSMDSFDEVVAVDKQRREVRRWKETNPLQARPGIRVLFLDGGGIRGLIQVMVLTEVERVTGRRITELFDWIVGTSVGAILALSLVYGKSKTLLDIRSLFMKLKSGVFNGILSLESNTKNLEKLLKEEFGEDTRLCDIVSTKVMVCAVNKKLANPKIEFFNNFMEGAPELTNVPVWMACRRTSAAPTYFHSCGDYVDGGVMANNPSMAAWAEIQDYYRGRGSDPPPISVTVSLGTGIYPDRNMGDVDIFGKNFFSLTKAVKNIRHLIEMLRNALSQSEETSRRFRALCNDHKIPYFRFNPDLFEVVATGETNDEKLINMMLQTRLYLQEGSTVEELSRMVTLFQHLSLLHSARAMPHQP